MTARIILRQQKVSTIAQVLTTIAKTQAAIVQQGENNLKKEADKPAPPQTNGKASPEVKVPDKTTLDRAQWAQCFLKSIVSAGQGYVNDQNEFKKATSAQQKLLTAISNNRDPATAFALVAVVGTGLDDNSFTLLDDYLGKLNEELATLQKSFKEAAGCYGSGEGQDRRG